MAAHRYDGPERRTVANNQSFRIPALVLIVAFIAGLLGLSAWALDLERRKADKIAVEILQADIKVIQTDVKTLLRLSGGGGGHRATP